MKLWSAETLAKTHFAFPYLVEPIIPRGGIVFFHGKRGIGKSHTALTIAACLIEHGALFGRYPTRAANSIVWVQADMPIQLMQQRVRRAQTTGYKLEGLHFLFPDFFNIMSQGIETNIVKEIVALTPSLIIWDTLRKIQHGDLNAQETSGLVYGWARHLFPGVTHLFIHHDRKDTVDNAELDEEESFSGNGAWIDNAQTGMHLKEIADRRLMLTFTKTQSAEPQAPIPLVLNTDALLVYASPEQATKLLLWYRERYPGASREETERFLLSSFVGSPRIAHQLAYGDSYDREANVSCSTG